MNLSISKQTKKSHLLSTDIFLLKNSSCSLRRTRKSSLVSLFYLFTICTLLFRAGTARADTATDIQKQIDARNASIAALDTEIAQYQSQLDAASTQANTLSNTIKQLDISKKKLEASITVTQDKIAATNLQIAQLNADIGHKQSTINDDDVFIAKSLAAIRENDDSSLIELILGQQSLSQAYTTIDNLASLQKSVQDKIAELKSKKKVLQDNVAQTKIKKAELVSLNTNLVNQRAVLVATEKDKASLLAQTKNSEANYKKIITDKAAQQAAFGQEILNYEKTLHLLTVTLKDLPATGSGVLHWPVNKVVITQYFGNTSFSTKNPQIYNGKGHTGMDFGAAIGTPIKAALDGVIVGVGNTDLIPGCYSYGKWIMIKHPDGLSTLYAHLSVPLVSKGQLVSTGDVIGYSGETGYATGPHLHFGVYATAGVVITDYVNSAHCKGAILPLADISAYLNPLSYLPH